MAVVNVNIIGDAFLDIICLLDNNNDDTNEEQQHSDENDNNNNNNTIPIVVGGDVLLSNPITAMAGGSGLNTATHLNYIIINQNDIDGCDDRDVVEEDDDAAAASSSFVKLAVEIQTCLNENDDHGKKLLHHAHQHQIPLINSYPPKNTSSTGHCMVIIHKNERSFLTHRGCISYFSPNDISMDRLRLPQQCHVHIAGYYNMPQFWNGATERFLIELQRVRAERGLPKAVISLVPQWDATGRWEGGLVSSSSSSSLLPLVDILIGSQSEIRGLSKTTTTEEDDDEDKKMMRFFGAASPHTTVIMTKGSKGAVAWRGSKVVGTCDGFLVKDGDVVDPTGAGDAFAAGFINGFWRKRMTMPVIGDEMMTKEDAIMEGMRWGCALGSCCVRKVGASVPPAVEDVRKCLELRS